MGRLCSGQATNGRQIKTNTHDTPHEFFVEVGGKPLAGPIPRLRLGLCAVFAQACATSSLGEVTLSRIVDPIWGCRMGRLSGFPLPLPKKRTGGSTSPEGEHGQQHPEVIGGERLGRQVNIAPTTRPTTTHQHHGRAYCPSGGWWLVPVWGLWLGLGVVGA